MTVSMYQVSVPMFVHFLSSQAAILAFAEKHFAGNAMVGEDWLMRHRLYPDMFPLSGQIRQATFHATYSIAALASHPEPDLPTDESSFKALIARIEASIGYLQAVKPEEVDGTEDKTVEYVVARKPRIFKGQRLLLGHCIPNFYFHCATAYDLLRQIGVPLGKGHFMGYARPGVEGFEVITA